MAHLFIRDPVSLFSEKIHQDDETDTDHFEVSVLSLVVCDGDHSCSSMMQYPCSVRKYTRIMRQKQIRNECSSFTC